MNLSQTEFARRFGFHNQKLSALETGREFASATIRQMIARRLGRAESKVFPEFLMPCWDLRAKLKWIGLSQNRAALLSTIPRERIRGFLSGAIAPGENEKRILTLILDPEDRNRLAKSSVAINTSRLFPDH